MHAAYAAGPQHLVPLYVPLTFCGNSGAEPVASAAALLATGDGPGPWVAPSCCRCRFCICTPMPRRGPVNGTTTKTPKGLLAHTNCVASQVLSPGLWAPASWEAG